MNDINDAQRARIAADRAEAEEILVVKAAEGRTLHRMGFEKVFIGDYFCSGC